MLTLLRSTIFTLALLLTAGLVSGCYTQVGTTKTDKFSGEYPQKEEVEQEDEYADAESTGSGTDYYFDEEGYPRDRHSLGYYSPSWVVLSTGWYDPWYWQTAYYNPFWCCWNMYPMSYGWWRPWYPYYSGYYYPSYGYPSYAGGSHGTTRTVGSTRGTTGGGRGRDAVEPGRIGDTQLPTGMRSAGSGRSQDQATPATPGRKGVDTGRSTGTRETPAVRGGTSRTGRGSSTTRTPARTPSRGTEQSPPPRQGGDTGARGGSSDTGGRTVSPPPPPPSNPPSTPPSGGGGRAPGENRGGGGGGRR